MNSTTRPTLTESLAAYAAEQARSRKRRARSAAASPAPVRVVQGVPMSHRGGGVWRCERCLSYITAECSCCEPPACTCSRRPIADDDPFASIDLSDSTLGDSIPRGMCGAGS